MSNDPNNPFNLQSQWNPFTNNQSSPSTTSTPNSVNSGIPGFGQYYTPTTQTQFSQTQYSQPQYSQPHNNDEYHEFLMWRSQNQRQPDIPSQADEIETPTPTRRKAKGKGKAVAGPSQPKGKKVIPNANFWEPEDELRLAESWIAISEDSNRGNAQTSASFWFLVVDEYNGRNPPFIRTKDALSSKWTKLNESCRKWGGIVDRLQRQRRSGEGDDDFRARCEAQYKMETLKKFQSHVAWSFLKDKQKWINPDPIVVGRRNVPKRRENVDLEELDLDEEPEEQGENPNAAMFGADPFPRPPGKSRQAKSQKTSSGSAASARSSFDETATSTFDDMSTYFKIKILQARTDGLSDVDKQIIEMKKAEARAKLGFPGSGSSGV